MAKKRGSQRRLFTKITEFWTNNPVLVNGLTIAPVAVAAIYLKNAVAISIAMAIITIPTLVISSLIKQRLALCHRLPLYAIISAVFYAGASMLIKYLMPSTVETLGIYLPLLVTNTIVVVRAEAFGVRNKTRWVLLDAIMQVLGYAFVICIVGALREYIGNATLWGTTVDNSLPISGISLPFGGFILLGLLVALFQLINNRARQRQLLHHSLQENSANTPQAEVVQ